MDVGRYNTDGTVSLVDGAHTYLLTLADCVIGGSPTVPLATTPPLACTTCGLGSVGAWSAGGSREAQTLVARALAAGAKIG